MKKYHIAKKSILLAAVAVMYGVTLHAQHVWTFDECVQYAIDHNIDIQRRAVDVEMEQNRQNTVKNDWMPTLSAVGAQRFSFGNALASTGTMVQTNETYNQDLSYSNVMVEFSMPVFDGFQRVNQKRAADWSIAQATAQLANSRKNLNVQLANYYLQVLYEKGMTGVAEQQVGTSRKMCDKTRILVEDGKNPKSDLADAEAQLADDEYKLSNARGRYQIALLKLSQLLNLETVEGFQIADITDESVLNGEVLNSLGLYDEVVENYPSIVAGKAQIEKSKHDISVARAGYFPKIDLRASLNTYYLNFFHQGGAKGFPGQFWDNKSYVVGLHFTVPIFNHFKTRNNIRQAKMAFQNNQLNLKSSRQQLRKEIDQAYYNAITARDKFKAAKKSEEASSLSYSYEQDKFEAGRSSTFDLIQAAQRLRKNREDAVQAKYEYVIYTKILNIYANQN